VTGIEQRPRHTRREPMEVGGIFGLLVLIADVWAILNIFQSSAEILKKVLWIVLVLVLPLLGVIIWYFAGPRAN
jgi:hypothetical protein